jgi:ferredoxin-like protein FixX
MNFFNAQGNEYNAAINYKPVRQLVEDSETLLACPKTTYKWKNEGYISFAWKDFKKTSRIAATVSVSHFFKNILNLDYMSIDVKNNIRINPEVLYHQTQSKEWRFDSTVAKTVAENNRAKRPVSRG